MRLSPASKSVRSCGQQVWLHINVIIMKAASRWNHGWSQIVHNSRDAFIKHRTDRNPRRRSFFEERNKHETTWLLTYINMQSKRHWRHRDVTAVTLQPVPMVTPKVNNYWSTHLGVAQLAVCVVKVTRFKRIFANCIGVHFAAYIVTITPIMWFSCGKAIARLFMARLVYLFNPIG